MNDGKLTRDETIALLTQLSSDDDFRARFEQAPAAALQSIGIGNGDASALPPAAASPEPLPSKEQLQQALNEVKEAGVSFHICLIFPLLKLTYGDNAA